MKILAKKMITNVQVMFDDQPIINFKVDSEKRICAVYQNMRTIPRELTLNYFQSVEILDISHNNLRDVSALSTAERLHTLIIDHNLLSSGKSFPRLHSLNVLWVNHNLISDLHDFVPGLARRCPAIRHLSLMGNEACANALTGASEQDQTRYRQYIISHFDQLHYLDDKKVTSIERLRCQNPHPWWAREVWSEIHIMKDALLHKWIKKTNYVV